MKLFAIYIGGTHEQALIELHDMRFVIANTIEDTYDFLRKSWWGIPKTLHIDAWGIVENVDGYDLKISNEPAKNQEQTLFFVNLGGYDPNQYTELHKNTFVVATDSAEAKLKAKASIKNWGTPHKDYLYEIDEILNIAELTQKAQYYIHLEPNKAYKPFQFTSNYIPIGK